MENFQTYNPTHLYFGKDVISEIGRCIEPYSKNVLLIYGKGSVKKNGIYEKVVSQIVRHGIKIYEYCGIKSNPVFEDVDAAAELARKNNVGMIVALGGGSVIDTAKMVAVTACVNHSSWDFFIKKIHVQKALPLICVLTLAATGSEMNSYAVIQNDATGQKLSFGHPLVFPKYAFLDPSYTISVPADYTAYGITDIVAHALEAFFGKGQADLSDKIICDIIKECIIKGPMLLKNLDNYELRADIMLAATLALNGTTMYGRAYGDWGVHGIGHVLSSMYDLPHGPSLSITYPAWLKHHKIVLNQRISKLGKLLFDTEDTNDTIDKLITFFKLINAPVSLNQLNLNISKAGLIDALTKHNVSGYYHKLNSNDYTSLVDKMYT